MNNQFMELLLWIEWSKKKELFFQNSFGCKTSQHNRWSTSWTNPTATISNTTKYGKQKIQICNWSFVRMWTCHNRNWKLLIYLYFHQVISFLCWLTAFTALGFFQFFNTTNNYLLLKHDPTSVRPGLSRHKTHVKLQITDDATYLIRHLHDFDHEESVNLDPEISFECFTTWSISVKKLDLTHS